MDQKETLIRVWEQQGILSQRLKDAFRTLKREDFIELPMAAQAYDDNPLPIGEGQTISQPTTIILMLHALDPREDSRVLEVGTGSGYNAALLGLLSKEVFTTEIIPGLAKSAEQNLSKAGIRNVTVIHSDGSEGHPEKAPFDRIILTAACPKIPLPLISQLKEGGIILAPVGEHTQKMIKGTKIDGTMLFESLGNFTFVPLKGKHGF